MSTCKRAREHQQNKDTHLQEILRQYDPADARFVESIHGAYHEERERLLAQSTRRLTEVAIFDTLCKQTFAQIIAHVSCEFRYYEAFGEICECMYILGSTLRELDADIFPETVDFATTRDAALRRVRDVVASGKARASAVDIDMHIKFQSRRFASKFNSVSKLIALARGSVNSTVFEGALDVERHRLHSDLVREDLFVGAIVMFERLRKTRMLAVVRSDWVKILTNNLGVCYSTRMGADAHIGALHSALQRSFENAVNRRFMYFQRACLIRSRTVEAENHIHEQEEVNARVREQIRLMQLSSIQ